MKAHAVLFSLGAVVVFGGAIMPVANEQAAGADPNVQAEKAITVPDSIEPKPAAIAAESSDKARADINKRLAAANAKFSGAIGDVVKLHEAGMDPTTIQAFIENSTIAYVPTADEILRLHKLGIPEPLIAGLIRRGGELRNQQAQTARGQEAVPTVPNPPAQVVVVPPVIPPTSYVQPPTYNYIVGGYPNYTAPIYPGYNYAYDWYPGLSFYYPSYGYRAPWRFSTLTFYNSRSPYHSFGHPAFPSRHNSFGPGTFHHSPGFRSMPAHSSRPAFHSGRHGSRF